MGNYPKFFDLTPYRNMELMRLLGFCNARHIDVEAFKEIFDLQSEGFFGILKFIADASNLERVIAYGNMCLSDTLSQATAQSIGAGKVM